MDKQNVKLFLDYYFQMCEIFTVQLKISNTEKVLYFFLFLNSRSFSIHTQSGNLNILLNYN